MNLKRVFFCLLNLSFFIFFTNCGSDNDLPIAGSYPKTVKVTYKITGSVKQGDILFTNETFGNTSLSNQAIPFTKQITATVKSAPTGIGFSISTSTGGTATLEILIDDKPVETKTFTGDSGVFGTAVYVFQ
ncbi:MAG: hypothetical protein HC817_11525 [Saprospiraceae bacterium]|nr:hypothetical protein [Saprospiraceae bacterium]